MSKLNFLKKTTSPLRASALIAGLAISMLSGCSYLEPYKAPLVQGNVMTQESIQLLQEGLTKSQVRELLGPPMGEHPFNPQHWEYTYYSSIENAQNKEHSLQLVLDFDKDNLLKSWKETEQSVQLKKDDSWLGLGWF